MTSERTRFFRSIRFRLTAWYALILFVIILMLGAGVAKVLERELRQDVDVRLRNSAEEMLTQFRVSMEFGSQSTQIQSAPPSEFSFPSQLLQIVSSDGKVVFTSENLGQRQLPTVSTEGDLEDQMRYANVEVDGENLRVLTYPILLRDSGLNIGAINVAEPLIQVDEMRYLPQWRDGFSRVAR
jgi:hypothetical protein